MWIVWSSFRQKILIATDSRSSWQLSGGTGHEAVACNPAPARIVLLLEFSSLTACLSRALDSIASD
jgi:hypothetical protein